MAIKFEKVNFEYGQNTPFSHHALNDINLDIKLHKITAIVGHTGSGKSTLVQHLNGLLKPTQGSLNILDYEINAEVKPKNLKKLRAEVGLVFQFPEMQLFEESIYKDVSFGPKNFGFTNEQIDQNVKKSLTLVGIAPELWERSPLDLSGGQKRRVAIAGVLATEPEVIVLDEPTAGLDPQGAQDMMQLFKKLNKEYNKTLIMVTHDMNHVLNYADEVVLMNQGSVVFHGPVDDFFTVSKNYDFVLPQSLYIKERLREKGIEINETRNVDKMASEIKGVIK